MIPNARFLELLQDIEPSPTTVSAASKAHTAVRGYLRSHKDFADRWEGDFLSGSYSRDTAIRPRKTADGYERPDVDIIVETSFSTGDHPDDVLQELSDALEDGFTVERINKRSVRVITKEADMDVVPVIPEWNLYQLPDRDLGAWRYTNPPGHNQWSKDQNDAFSGRFKPLVKLLKWWKRENPTGKRPKGFILEVLAAQHAPRHETHYGEIVAQMLEGIRDAYADLADSDVKPYIDDPGLPGNDIMSRVSIADWKSFINRVRTHAGYARRAQDEGDAEEATRLWRKLFGDRFKATSTAAKATSLASSVAAPAAGAAYVFPDRSAAPSTPRSFA